mmetsp:Transcript_4167/g.12544  ORF Transcript_4167/g.12544 Transcript_4167/m.12544 type:complete len:283 (+) Transcript_4167:488-1336(+)
MCDLATPRTGSDLKGKSSGPPRTYNAKSPPAGHSLGDLRVRPRGAGGAFTGRPPRPAPAPRCRTACCGCRRGLRSRPSCWHTSCRTRPTPAPWHSHTWTRSAAKRRSKCCQGPRARRRRSTAGRPRRGTCPRTTRTDGAPPPQPHSGDASAPCHRGEARSRALHPGGATGWQGHPRLRQCTSPPRPGRCPCSRCSRTSRNRGTRSPPGSQNSTPTSRSARCGSSPSVGSRTPGPRTHWPAPAHAAGTRLASRAPRQRARSPGARGFGRWWPTPTGATWPGAA